MSKKIKIKEIKKEIKIKPIDSNKASSLESSVSTQEFSTMSGSRVSIKGLSSGELSESRTVAAEPAPQPERREMTNAEIEAIRYDSARVYTSKNKYDPTINSQVLPESKTTIRSTMVEDSSLIRNRSMAEQQSMNPFSEPSLIRRADSDDRMARQDYDEGGVKKEKKKSSMF